MHAAERQPLYASLSFFSRAIFLKRRARQRTGFTVNEIMRRAQYIEAFLRGRRTGVWGILLVALCALFVLWALSAHRAAPAVVETVTTGARAPAPAQTPVYFTPQLPVRDEEIELAGDRIAEVEVYLKKRQSAAALAALGRARRATAHALEARQRKGTHGDALLSALTELASVPRSLERGALADAHRQLVALDKSLDHLSH